MVDNYDSQQQATNSRKDPFRNIGANINDRDSRENGGGVTSRTQEEERSNDRVEEVDEVEVGNGKRKRQDSASPSSRCSTKRRIGLSAVTTGVFRWWRMPARYC